MKMKGYITAGILLFSLTACVRLYGAHDHTQNTMTTDKDKLTQPIVRRAIDALQAGDKTAWFALFDAHAALYDDGNEKDFKSFFSKALGHERFTSIDKVDNNGLHVYGHFHSDTWGDFKTYFRFYINDSGRITRLDIGQADY